MDFKEWDGFCGDKWKASIDVRAFIQDNYTPYSGDESFLCAPTVRTKELFQKLTALLEKEHKRGGVLAIDNENAASVLNHGPGFLDKDKEIIVGLQTDEPLKRAVNPFGGIRTAISACKAYGVEFSPIMKNEFKYRTTHNDGVFRAYTEEMRRVRKSGVITGLPDAYGRGRIIGDYRRVALYGVEPLISFKIQDKARYGEKTMDVDNIRKTEELFQQISFLQKLLEMARMYGYDISRPANNTKEAVQWLYFAYLAAIKEQNGAAMSLGRVSDFIDIYAERDLKKGIITETEIQEIVDDFVMKLRMARHLRTPDYNELFGGDPMWITESLGGMGEDGRTLVTKSAYRFLNTLFNLSPAPEPNLTILWSDKLPESFKKYCAKVSYDTDSIQYENDEIMRPVYGDDYGIACCVSAMKLGKQMQFFGARCNLPKLLLLSLNGGRDENTGMQIGPEEEIYPEEVLDYGKVTERLYRYMDWLCKTYVNIMNIIHYMHDKYAYEKIQMALHDTEIERLMAFGIAGLSVLADSLSAIKYAKVMPIKNENDIITDFITDGDFPKYGNDDDRVDSIAVKITDDFIAKLRQTPAYRNAKHTLSVLTITSNVVYGKKTGSTPDGRKKGEPFAPGANPMHNREQNGALASLNSVAKIKYESCRDGISNTFTITPSALGKTEEIRITNLVTLLDGYFLKKAHHLNVNVLNRQQLIDALDHPELYPNLTIRVSGYAVNFHKLNRAQQLEVISRTFHERV